jgi:tetratricopeptide (TPR) repeat protein
MESYQLGIRILEKNSELGKVDYSKALDYFDESVKYKSNNIESLYWKMHCEIQLGQFDNALQTSISVINDFDNDNHKLLPSFYVSAGIVEKINGNIDNSIIYFEKAEQIYGLRVDKNINDTDAIMNKALMLCYMDKKEDAIEFVNLISLNEEKQIILEQIRDQVLEFDLDTLINNLVKIKK